MILRSLYLYPDLVEYNGHPALGRFRDSTRSLCHFVGQRVAREKFRAPFGRICVIGKRSPESLCDINSCNVLAAHVPLTPADFAKLDSHEPNEFFIGLLLSGLRKVAEQHDIPVAAYTEGIEAFREAGYRNAWTWKSARPRGLGLKISLDCSLTMQHFELRMRVYSKDLLLLDDLVLQTVPDEICFEHQFKKLEVAGATVSVLDHLGRPTYSRDLSDLLEQWR